MRATKIISLMATAFILSACSADDNPTSAIDSQASSPTNEASQTSQPTAHSNKAPQVIDTNIAATIGDKVISLETLDKRIQFGLFDLEWQKYQLRKEALKSFFFEENQSNDLSDQQTIIALIPPTPPRVAMPKDKRPVKGAQHAPVILDIFCSYQSSHCARLFPVLSALEDKYSGIIGLRFFDYPQRFHRYGISAANAFRCAAEFSQNSDQLWSFQSALFANIDQLNQPRYLTLAEQLKLNSTEFEACLTENKHQNAIASDLALGKGIGLGNVPVVFINGLYVKGANPKEMYSFYINQELETIGFADNIQASQLPLTLIATTVSNIANQSTAELALQEDNSVVRVKIGDSILADVRIIDIQSNQVLINNQGVMEFIKINASQGHQLADATYDTLSTNEIAQEDETEYVEDEEPTEENYEERTLPVTGEMTLSREWVDNQLLNQTALEKHFYNAEHVVEGNHLIKLDNIDNQRFYTTLGLKTGDVVMRINDQWVHETQNPLWASLQQNEAITLTLMRKGLPYRYDYRIE